MITQATSRQVEPDITVVTITGRLNLGNTLMSLENDLRKQIQNGAEEDRVRSVRPGLYR